MQLIGPMRTKRPQIKATAEAATALGIDRTTLWRWLNVKVPAERVLDAEKVLKVSREKLRPDLYPTAPAPSPEEMRP